jgi:ATP-binding cassette subfamily B protein
MGLLEPSEGRVSIDGRTLSDETRVAWQAQIAHVPQSIFLADTTIARNIAFGSAAEEIDIERVRWAATIAQADEFIQTLPENYDTFVGERGIRLSGGQRQRIGIARALYKRAQVLVFDEATSALDGETEAAVINAIAGIGGEITLVVIAHRQASIAHCDTIVRLERGRVISSEAVKPADAQEAARHFG